MAQTPRPTPLHPRDARGLVAETQWHRPPGAPDPIVGSRGRGVEGQQPTVERVPGQPLSPRFRPVKSEGL